MEIKCLCKECNIITSHDFQKSIKDDVLTTIAVCKTCGKATVDCGPIDDEEEKRVPFSEKGISDCTDCCRCCSEFECPANETRCQ